MKKILLFATVLCCIAEPVSAQWIDLFRKRSREQQTETRNGETRNGERRTRETGSKNGNFVENIHALCKDMPKITGKPLPVIENWELVRSNTVAGFKCDHYEKGDKALRVFYKENGDFMTLDEDPDGLAREPMPEGKLNNAITIGETRGICPIGEYRLTTQDGIVINGNFDDYFIYCYSSTNSYFDVELKKEKIKGFKLTFPNGDAIGGQQEEMCTSGFMGKQKENSAANWDNFKSGTKKLVSGDYYFNSYAKWLYLKEELGKRYPYIMDKGFLIGDRTYVWDFDTKTILAPIGQFYGTEVYGVNATDTIVSVKKVDLSTENMSSTGTRITYANGDNIVFENNGPYVKLYSGKIHRPSGLVTIKTKNRKLSCRIDYPDGKVFAGHLTGTIPSLKKDITTNNQTQIVKTSDQPEKILMADDVRPWTGTYEYPNGSIVNLTNGKTDQELAEERAAREAAIEKARLAREKAEKQERQALNNKYGKKYVDIVYDKKFPIVGMPFELANQFYDCRLSSSDRYSQIYHLYSYRFNANATNYSSYDWTMTLYVRNGIITAITKW